MSYIKYNIRLTKGQKEKLLTSYQKKAPITLRLKHSQLSGSDEVFLTRRQITKIEKSRRDRTGTDIKISQSQIRKQSGGNLFSSLMKVGSMALPYLSKIGGPLLSGALSGLSSLGVDKLFGSGLFSIPQNKVDQLIRYKSYLTDAQKKQIMGALKSGSGIDRFKLTKKQSGGFLGTLLASIGIPLVMNMLTGKGAAKGHGLHVDPARVKSSKSVYIPKSGKTGWGHMMPPPFYGNWDRNDGYEEYGMGMKKKAPKKKRTQKAKGLLLGKNSPFKGIPILGALL